MLACRDDEELSQMKTLVKPKSGAAVEADSKSVSTECQICHVVVSYVREALNNKATEDEIEAVRRRLADALLADLHAHHSTQRAAVRPQDVLPPRSGTCCV